MKKNTTQSSRAIRLSPVVAILALLAFPHSSFSQTVQKKHFSMLEEHAVRGGSVREQEYLDILEEELNRRFKIYLGASFPMGEFKEKDIYSSRSGYAQLGFGGGVEYTHELRKGVGFILSGMITGYSQDVSEWKRVYPWFTFDGDNRFLYWAMGGLFLDHDFSRSATLYGFAEMGLLYADYPNLKVKDAYDATLTITAPSVATLGYGAGIGLMLRKYDISVKYLLGNPVFNATAQLGRDKSSYEPEQKPVRAVQVMVGFLFN